jgi:chemosensory pili system protein ChpA (sensor histidine kinase/response regulator)
MAAHRASSHGMIGRLLETTADARRNVTRLQSLAMKIGNECASLQPEEIAPEDDLTLESYNTLNTLILQLQEAVSDQLALVQGIHDTITNHWSLQATESRVDADIQSALMNIRLIPLSNMRVRLDGVVRQAAEATGKKVRWQLQGGNVSVEKNVFDKLFEPLMHLLRNAVDHGIEPAPGRRAAGKPETGSITVAAMQDGNQIVITVADDGAGIVPNKIATLAVDRGIIGTDEAGRLSYQQKMDLIFTPGFSTAKEVSHLSGRGVGMDAVREACLRMGGTIEVGSRQGSGTTFTLRLPLSLSVTRGLIIRDSGCLMAVPVAQVSALHLVPASDVVETATGRVARLEGQELPVYNLPSLPGAGRSGYIQNGEVNVLQVAHEGGSVGLVIEDVLGEEEILIKAPPALLRPVKTLLGAHVLPDGRVAPVVNLPQMLVDLQPVATLSPPRQPDAADELTALVVDDSMSMRVALTGTLQSAGFKVLTARDGQEALDVLKREGLPGLITLDVEMPRMDGLETLFAIRQMPGAEDLPIFMMTSRGGARHRRAAEQLGATRYFTKPYRDSELSTAARAACMSA